MSQSTAQFITRMKLRELHRQRDKLREAYLGLGSVVAAARDPADRLRRLYGGLRGLKFAGQPLHPEVVNLEVLRYEADSGTIAPDVLALWVERLEKELAAGRTRSEFVYLFGALLEEWAREGSGDARLREEGREARAGLLAGALADPAPDRHHEVLDPLFDGLGPALADLAGRLQETSRKELRAAVTDNELGEVLEQLGADIYRPPLLRREARRFTADDQLRKELADALTILVADLDAWDWPASGLATHALWTRNKWRLYLDEDLPTACLLEILGDRWIGLLNRLIGDRSAVHSHRVRLRKLTELKSPAVILENERRMLREAEQMLDLGIGEGADPWDASDDTLAPEPGSIVSQRSERQSQLRNLDVHGDYDGDYGAANRAILLVHAEVQLARAAFPDRPLFVVKADIRDYYPSIPHDVLLTLLRRLGVAEADLTFFERFLSPPLQGDDGRVTRMRRGVPMGHTLSGMLGEFLMRLLERHVLQRARVRIVRLVDDIGLLTPDPEAALAGLKEIGAFCETCGLRVNEPKSGAVCIGGNLPDGLPDRRPRWGMLELDERGQWHVHVETFEAHREQSRARVAASPSVLSRVQQYNANVKFLLNALSLGGALGNTHRDSINRAIRAFHHDFFGEGQGVVAGLGTAIRERFQADLGEAADIPEGWVYWPITAGGLGLKNPLVVAGQYDEAFRTLKLTASPAARPIGWDRVDHEWGVFYVSLGETLSPSEPDATKVMEALVEDFIARGAELSAGRQTGLSAYWRWILCTYGPQILERFGTFRFLITELVPLQLIGRQLVRDSSLGEADPGRAGEEIPF